MRKSVRHSFVIVFSAWTLSACYVPPQLDYNAICVTEDPICLAKDNDGDGVENGDDDFPFDRRCDRLNNENCTRCGVGCESPLVCIKTERQCGMLEVDQEVDRGENQVDQCVRDGDDDDCDGLDNDSDLCDEDECMQIDPDGDGDSIVDQQDNCRDIANPDQADTDQDGLGDACDPDPNVPNLTLTPVGLFTSPSQQTNENFELFGELVQGAHSSTTSEFKLDGTLEL